MTDDLRERLTYTAARSEHKRARLAGETRDVEWDDMTGLDQLSWYDERPIDALMPVVRAALADAWDDGLSENMYGTGSSDDNPWRVGD